MAFVGFVVADVVLVPIAGDVAVLQVEAASAGGVVVAWDLLLLMGVFRLLALLWLREALMSVLGQLLPGSFTEVLAAVLLCGK